MKKLLFLLVFLIMASIGMANEYSKKENKSRLYFRT